MKETFSGYYKDKDLASALRKGELLIVLDPSALCNIYGFIDEDQNTIIQLLEKVQDALWLPYSMALAYHRGILPAIKQKIHLLVSLKNRLTQTMELLNTLPMSFPEKSEYERLAKNISSKLTREIALIKQRGKKDSNIRERIAQLYKGKVGAPNNNEPYAQSYIVTSYKEIMETDALTGSSTTTMKKDSDTETLQDKNDVILHILIHLSSDKHKDVLYVTNEPSSYWSAFIGRTSYGPNSERQTYFKSKSENNFYCCPFASFMQQLAASFNEPLNDQLKGNLKKMCYGTISQNDDADLI